MRLAGVGVGEVKSFSFIRDPQTKKRQVELDIFIQQDKQIEKDARFLINQLGFFGERYVEVEGGTPGTPFLAAGDMVIGQDPVPWDKVQDDLAGLIAEGREAVTALKNVVADAEAQESLKTALQESGPMMKSLRQVADRADRVLVKLEKGEGTIGRLVSDDALYNDLAGFAADIRRNPWKILHKTKEKKPEPKPEAKQP